MKDISELKLERMENMIIETKKISKEYGEVTKKKIDEYKVSGKKFAEGMTILMAAIVNEYVTIMKALKEMNKMSDEQFTDQIQTTINHIEETLL